jgi:zinc transport system ATP-binding protein
MGEAAVEVKNVTVTLGHQRVLDDVTFAVPRGEYVALIGPNGGGKTTLLRVLLGLVRPQQGSVRVFGAGPEEVRGRVGYVPQHARFDLGFPIRVADVVHMGRLGDRPRPSWMRRGERRKVIDILEQLEVADLAERPIGKLSGGQLQRVLIARALAVEPELLILDEPTASLDVQSSEAFYDLIQDLARRMTVLIASHDVTGVSARVDSIACLNRRLFFHPGGELPASALAEVYGCPVELLAHGGVPHRVLGHHDGGEGSR